MARKKRVVEAPKRASSPAVASLSDEEEEPQHHQPQQEEADQNDTDEEDRRGAEDEEEEEEEINPSTPTKAKNSDAGSDSDDASESTLPSPSLADYTIKPITPKRPAAKAEPEKGKRKEPWSSSTPNGGAIQRLWSEDDEIELLKGMVRFRSEKGMDPNLVMNVFHEFIKGSFSVEMAKNQLVSKIKRVKKKYVANCGKAGNGKDVVLTNPHEMKAFELSKKVWGDGGSNASKVRVKLPSGGDGGSNAPKVRVKVASGRSVTLALPCGGVERKMKPEKKALSQVVKMNIAEYEGGEMEGDDDAEEDVGEDSWETEFPFLSEGLQMEGLTEGVKETVRKRMREADKVVLGRLDRKWNKLKKAELELFVRRTQLVAEQVNLVLNIIKSESPTS